MENNRNLLLTVALSVLILFGWQYFFPQRTPSHLIPTKVESGSSHSVPMISNALLSKYASDTNAAAPTTVAPFSNNVIEPRIKVETPSLTGSINLKGGQLDDLKLKKYHETVSNESPLISLLNPERSPKSFFTEIGYLGDSSLGTLPDMTTVWNLEQGDVLTPQTPIVLSFQTKNGLLFKRTISVDNNYLFTLTDVIKNTANQSASFLNYGRILKGVQESDAQSNYLLHEGLLGVMGNNRLVEISYKKIKSDPLQTFSSSTHGWLGITDKYWGVTLIPQTEVPYVGNFSYRESKNPTYQVDFKSNPLILSPGQSISLSNHIFAGAKEVSVVEQYASQYNINRFDLLIDWGWFRFFTKPMFFLIDWLYASTKNFGIAIIITTILLKIAVFPLANRSYRSMAKMRLLQPKIETLKKRYANDRTAQQRELVAFYKKEQINPTAGCLPVLLQFPIFFSLYKVLYITIEMRHAPFFGWIHDLAAPDPTSFFNLFGFLNYSVPGFLNVGAWPLIMGLTMFLQMRLSPSSSDPAQAIMKYWLPIFMTYILAGFPAGLVIYWACNNTLTIIQQMVIMRKYNSPIKLLADGKKIMSYFKR